MSASRIDGVLYWTLPNGTAFAVDGDHTNCTVEVCPIDLSVYGYRPTLPGSATLIALYGICMIVHIVLGWRYKTWAFMAAMLLGCIDEILGYAGRILYYQNPWKQPGFIMQIVCVSIGPVFFSAAIYVMLSKIIVYTNTKASRFNPVWFYWIFIPCDVVSLILQAIGGAMSSTSNGKSKVGVDIALAGLSFQVATLACFSMLVADYAFRSRRTWLNFKLSAKFKIFCAFLTLATLTIFIRCCYRVYELSEGYSRNSEALRDEPLFIGLESVMVIVAAYALIIAHPGPVFVRGSNEGPAAQEERITEDKVRHAIGSSDESD